MSYLASISVDKAQGVIAHVQADHADGKDSQFLISIVESLQKRFKTHNLSLKKVVADAGYSSGENYQYLENKGITPYIPIHGQFTVEREGFSYDEQKDCFICPQGEKLIVGRLFIDRSGYPKKTYRLSRTICKACPIREACLGKVREKKFDITFFYNFYQRAYQRQTSSKGQYHKKLRQSKVEPVLGTLINFLGLRRLNARGKSAAHKVMLLSAVIYNLKKLLKYTKKKDLAQANALKKPIKYFTSIKPFVIYPN
jgi:hypothetical protein